MRAPEIKAARQHLRETQAVFAERFGVDQATIHRWETDGPPIHGTARKAIERVLADLGAQQEPDAEASS